MRAPQVALAGFASTLALVPASALAAPAAECSDHSLVDILVAAEAAKQQSPKTGIVAEHLTEQFVRSTCAIERAGAWFPHTCAARKATPRRLEELRTAVVRDVLELSREALADPDVRVPASWVLLRSVVETLRAGGDPRVLAFVLGAKASTHGRCLTAVQPLAAGLDAARAKRVRDVGQLLAAAAAAAALDAGAPPESQRPEALAALGRTATQAQLGVLMDMVAEADRLSREAWPTDAQRAAAHAGRMMAALGGALDAALTIVDGTLEQVPAVAQMSAALTAGDIVGVAQAQLASAKQGLAMPEPVVSAATRGLALARAENLDDAREILRKTMLPMWDERFLFDINADVPRLESGRFRFAGDVLFGFQRPAWGVAVRGGAGYYDTLDEDFRQETIRGGGDLEAWWVSRKSATWRVELRGEAEAGVYDTSTIDLRDSATSTLAEETSVVARGNLMVAMRYEPPARVAMLLSAGAGGQFENYYAVDVASDGDGFGTIDNDSGSVTGEARLRVQVQIIPKWVVGRARVDARYLRLSRLERSFFAGSGAVDIGSSAGRGHQVEAMSRVFLDFEALRFGGFVPTLHGGLDMFHLRLPEGGPTAALVGLFGAGIRRVAF